MIEGKSFCVELIILGAIPPPAHIPHEVYDDTHMNDEESIPDDNTVASASFMGEEDRYDMGMHAPGSTRKRKREDDLQKMAEQAHTVYSDELLDYFVTHESRPEPPPNFQPNFPVDTERHTALHWAAAMGDVDVMKELDRFGASLDAPNCRGETPLMRSVLFTNCLDKQTMPQVVKQLINSIDTIDQCGSTALHHAAAVTISRNKHACARYYLDIILNKMQELFEPEQVQRIIDAQDTRGDTAVHIAARFKARKCVRALIGRGASTDIPNHSNVTAEDLIQDLNNSRRTDRHPHSSSPYAPETTERAAFHDALAHEEQNANRQPTSHHSEAAMSIQSKVSAQIQQKLQELAQSYDEELIDKEHSEKEAKRILNSTIIELTTVREQINEWSHMSGEMEHDARMAVELEHLQARVDDILERQQELNLRMLLKDTANPSLNGHETDDMNSDAEFAERIRLARQLAEQQSRRQTLVLGYREALARQGAGEKAESYRRLIGRCLDLTGKEIESLDDNAESLIEQLEESHGGREVVIPDGPL